MKITKRKLRQLIKEELDRKSEEVADSKKWATITMGARISFPEWEMLSGGGRMKKLSAALKNEKIRSAFEEAYSNIKGKTYREGKPIALSFFEKLRGVI